MLKGLTWLADKLPAIKLGLHIAQFLFAFVIFCLEIAVFRAPLAAIVGNNGWTLGVVFLSIPAWAYLGLAPRFPRTRKLANPSAMAVVDGLFTIIWLSAFATQAAYNTANLCGSACGLSKAIVGLAFCVCVFFGMTTFLSLYTVQYYNWNNRLPGYDAHGPLRTGSNIDPDKAAFSMAPHGDEEAYAPLGGRDDHEDHDLRPAPSAHHDGSYGGGGGRESYGYGGGGSNDPSPYRPQQHENPFETAHSYHSQDHVGAAAGHTLYAPPAVQDDYDDHRPVQFPEGNYDRAVR